MKKVLIVVAALIAVLVAGFVFVKGTPQYSLYQFKKAVQNHDPDTAFKYLDVDSVVDNLALDLINSKEMNKPASNPWEEAGQTMAKGLMTVMLPSIKEAMKGQIKTAITTADSEKSENDKGTNTIKGLNKGSWSDFDVKVEGKMAIVTNKQDEALKFKMVKSSEGYWKIIKIIIPHTK
ncbi:DUF2939 domain-containing protein [Geomonas subterranea]|uniref:DUF2939 domain-containing protein n=1 Tax=Geomonas subterranea TaxID=2847989 RepID=A0ABX8LPC6_9BACT|nr:DUF2939 domain-containing protein [Geomonas subterranea]QXE92787.1 DUF2939 domain-containing protein [Geomonas subterranea]QXM09110.1 DUF2939 domain-containing protein [Geomonas subterranea]